MICNKNSYGIPYIELDNFEDIKIGKYHYNYKTVDFMFNYKENSEKLLIVFHGRVYSTEKWPVFYKYNYEKYKVSVLSLCDRLLKDVREFHNTMFSSTNKNNYDIIYLEIIKNIINVTQTQKNIFFGSCSGTFPALYYGSLCNGIVLCSNGYVIFEQETYEIYKDKIYLKNSEIMIHRNIFDTLKISQPYHIYLYVNKYDNVTFEMNKKLILFLKKNYPNILTTIIHGSLIENKDPHDIHFPEGENFDSVFDKI